MTDSPVLKVSVLGALAITLDGRPVTGFASTKVQALFCYLLLTARPCARDTLIGLLWCDMLDADARTNLRQALSNLRRLVGDHLLIDRDTVTFDRASSYWLDAEEFSNGDWRLEIGREAWTPSLISKLQSLISLYRGDLLEGYFVRDAPEFEEWLVIQRERYRQQALQVFHTLLDYSLTHHEYARGIDFATRLLALDPWREEAHCQLMMLYARNGQRGAALAQYDTCRRLLTERIGVKPSAETNALYERIRATDTTKPNLPPQATPFVGRETELAQIDVLLMKTECRMITLLGQGGIGKTRLAIHAAAKQAGAFLNGIHFVSLTAVTSPDLIPVTIADAVKITLSGKAEPLSQVIEFLRDKEILLVLDNFEQLVDGATLLADMLNAAHDVKMIVTSRERLNLQCEWTVPVEGLPVPVGSGRWAVDSGTEDSQFASVQLFLQSAGRVHPRLAPNADEMASIVRICQLVYGVPLGIELAAASVTTQSCREIAREIETDLNSLATTQRDIPERQRSLRAVFEHSWNLLAEEEQRVLRALSVFRGGFTLKAAEAVVGGQGAGDRTMARVLGSLMDKSLLRRDANERYDLHEMVRQFAEEKLALAANEAELIAHRHTAYFAEFLYQRTKDANGAHKNLVLDEIDAEMGNIRAAWQWAIANQKWHALGRALECLYFFYDIRSRFQEGKEAFSAAATVLAKANDTTDQSQLVLAQLLARHAIFHYRDDDLAQARLSAETSLAIAQRLGSSKDIVLMLNCLGNIAWSLGEYTGARQWHLENLAIARQDGDPWRISVALNNLGNVANSQGDLIEARKLFEECIMLKRQIGDRRGLAISLDNFGLVASNQRDYAVSLKCRQEALLIFREIGDKDGVARALNNIGRILYVLEKYSEAQLYLQESLATSQEIGNREDAMYARNNLGAVACERGDYAQAEKHLRAALKIAMDIRTIPIALSALNGMAKLDTKLGRGERAVELLALVLNHPAATLEAKHDAESLLAELTAQLELDAVTVAQERGRALTLEQAVEYALGHSV